MRISPVVNNLFTAFSGIKERKEFRHSAVSVLKDLKNVEAGTIDYILKDENEPSLKERLHSVLKNASEVGKEYATAKDYLLLQKCKEAYVEYQEAEDFMGAMMGGGGFYIDRKKQADEFTF